MSYRLIRPLFFALDAERAHNLSIALLRMMLTPAPLKADLTIITGLADFTSTINIRLIQVWANQTVVAAWCYALTKKS